MNIEDAMFPIAPEKKTTTIAKYHYFNQAGNIIPTGLN